MLKRTLTGTVITVAVIILSIIKGWPLRLFMLAVMLMSTWEMYSAFTSKGSKPVKAAGYLFNLLTWGAAAFSDRLTLPLFSVISPYLLCISLCFFVALAVVICRGKVDFDSFSCSVFPILYPGLFFAMMLPMQDLNGEMLSTLAIMLTFFIASVDDVFAYLFGCRFGRHRLSPEISPHKSVEGSVAGFVGTVGFSCAIPCIMEWVRTLVPEAWAAFTLPPVWAFALLGAGCAVAGQFGDLCASMIKRHCGIKDFGRILPGHGGIMDRVDGILLTGCLIFIFFRLAGN